MRSEIDAIAFDIDGTLYSNWAFYRYLGPFLRSHARLLSDFGKVRKKIRVWEDSHPGERHEDFFAWQGELMSPYLHCTPAEARSILDREIYDGWKPLFLKVRPFPHLMASFTAFRESGLKIGLLSDFKPEQKADVWGLAPLCDVILGSEYTGALKPSPVPFKALSDALQVPPGRILYVGNSLRSDVRGASACGMKTACIVSPFSLPPIRREADIYFSDYRQLTRNVLK
jgi:putative hydrolase of the HAD superfamily